MKRFSLSVMLAAVLLAIYSGCSSRTIQDESPSITHSPANEGVEWASRGNYGKRLEPMQGGILHGAGQSDGEFRKYYEAVGACKPLLYMTYFNLKRDANEFFARLESRLSPYEAGLIPQIGLSMTRDGSPTDHYEQDVAAGRHDGDIDSFCLGLKKLNRPAFVRIGYEFNGAWNGYQPEAYKAAWRRIVYAFRRHGLENVASVWCYHPSSGVDQYSAYYPGDDFVDWWGIDLFSPSHFEMSDAIDFVQEAERRGFPVMIGESTPRGVGVLEGQTSWDSWFAPYFQFIGRHPNVKAFCYISWDWANFLQWKEWGNARITENSVVLHLYRNELRRRVYLHGNPSMNPLKKILLHSTDPDWQSLFNGRDLTGWTVQCKPEDRGKDFWRVEDGAILADSIGHTGHDYVWLTTNREYRDFILRLRFQAFRDSPGNSGVQVRSRYDQEEGWLNGPQIDINPPGPWRTGMMWDETRGNQRWIFPDLPKGEWVNESMADPGLIFHYHGDAPAWNDLEIRVEGFKVQTRLNGVLVTDFDGAGLLNDEAHRSRCVGEAGLIALQIHTGDQLKIRYKDIKIRELGGDD
ncbi:MAG: DUF1080 domain-containing protein [Candidatus Omnitrophica bacterium]|nr:DUF1080 domain-containing protein [Candidatus Omnitrophota bacterium]